MTATGVHAWRLVVAVTSAVVTKRTGFLSVASNGHSMMIAANRTSQCSHRRLFLALTQPLTASGCRRKTSGRSKMRSGAG